MTDKKQTRKSFIIVLEPNTDRLCLATSLKALPSMLLPLLLRPLLLLPLLLLPLLLRPLLLRLLLLLP